MHTSPVKAVHPESQPFLDGLALGRVRFQRCAACGSAQHLARLACRECGTDAFTWHDAAGTGVIQAVSTVWRAPAPEFKPLVPYTLVIARLTEGPRLMGHGAAGARPGDAVRAGFFEHGGRTLLRFIPAGEPVHT
jgi:uncharacterized OB-fold protein